MWQNLESIAESLVADGKGILAADETVPTLTKRFDTLGIKSTGRAVAPTAKCILGALALRNLSAGRSCMTKRSVSKVRRTYHSPRF
jgi:fructose-bisphosphate aldolase class 1